MPAWRRMPSPRPPQTHLLLVCLCASVQRVGLSSRYCGVSWCLGNSCCNGECCSPFTDNWINWFSMAFILFLVLIGGACLLTACRCCKNCAALQSQEDNGLAQRPATPATQTAPPGSLESPPEWPQEDPPPYSEVAAKPFMYPLPALPPPSYSHVVGAEPPSTGVSPPDHTPGAPVRSPPAGFEEGQLGDPPLTC